MTSRISQQSGFSLQLIFKNLLRSTETKQLSCLNAWCLRLLCLKWITLWTALVAVSAHNKLFPFISVYSSKNKQILLVYRLFIALWTVLVSSGLFKNETTTFEPFMLSLNQHSINLLTLFIHNTSVSKLIWQKSF